MFTLQNARAVGDAKVKLHLEKEYTCFELQIIDLEL